MTEIFYTRLKLNSHNPQKITQNTYLLKACLSDVLTLRKNDIVTISTGIKVATLDRCDFVLGDCDNCIDKDVHVLNQIPLNSRTDELKVKLRYLSDDIVRIEDGDYIAKLLVLSNQLVSFKLDDNGSYIK